MNQERRGFINTFDDHYPDVVTLFIEFNQFYDKYVYLFFFQKSIAYINLNVDDNIGNHVCYKDLKKIF